jgi:hypothetical protein
MGKEPGSDLTSDFNRIASLVPPAGDFGLLQLFIFRRRH